MRRVDRLCLEVYRAGLGSLDDGVRVLYGLYTLQHIQLSWCITGRRVNKG